MVQYLMCLAPIGDSEAQSETPDKTQNHNFEAQSGSRWVHITTRNETPSQTQMDDFGGDGGRVGGIEHDNPPWISLKISSMVKKKSNDQVCQAKVACPLILTCAHLCGLIPT